MIDDSFSHFVHFHFVVSPLKGKQRGRTASRIAGSKSLAGIAHRRQGLLSVFYQPISFDTSVVIPPFAANESMK